MKKYEITEEAVNKVLNYLASKPYVEVFQLIPSLQHVKEIKEEPVLVPNKEEGTKE